MPPARTPFTVAFLIGLTSSSLIAQGAPQRQPASSAKVEVTILAQADSPEFYVSSHGGHLAALTQRGSRPAITYDGVQGPAFDEIVDESAGAKKRVAFSPDGGRYAYVGRSGQEYVVMVDGKEQIRLPVATIQWDLSWSAGRTLLPQFTPNGKHTYFMVLSDVNNRGGMHRLFFDGQAVPAKWPQPVELVLSADGDHFAYVSTSTSAVTAREWQLIVDGKPAGYEGAEPQFTADGKHVFTRSVPAGWNGQRNGLPVVLLLDGKSFIRADDAKLYVPPVGYGVVAVVTRNNAEPAARQFLVIDGKRVPGSDAGTIDRVWFSPDGKHYAAECELPSGKGKFMFIDGKRGQEYQLLTDLQKLKPNATPFAFSADSAHWAYIGNVGDKEFAVIDGQESEGYYKIFSLTFGARGKRVGFVGFGNNQRDRWVSVDGKKAQSNFANADLTFSADGSRYAYTALGTASGAAASHARVVIDGVASDGIQVIPLQSAGRAASDPMAFLMSSDGKHVLHYGGLLAERRAVFVIDGKLVRDRFGINPANVTFTPDGRHLLWFETIPAVAGPPTERTLFVDGRTAQSMDPSSVNLALLTNTPGSWDMGADGILTVVAIQGGAFKRFRISPPDDTSIDTLLASGAAR